MSDLTDALDRVVQEIEEWDHDFGGRFASDLETIVAAARRWTAVQEAIVNEGPHPSFHRKVMRKHKEEWPTLWAALEGK